MAIPGPTSGPFVPASRPARRWRYPSLIEFLEAIGTASLLAEAASLACAGHCVGGWPGAILVLLAGPVVLSVGIYATSWTMFAGLTTMLFVFSFDRELREAVGRRSLARRRANARPWLTIGGGDPRPFLIISAVGFAWWDWGLPAIQDLGAGQRTDRGDVCWFAGAVPLVIVAVAARRWLFATCRVG